MPTLNFKTKAIKTTKVYKQAVNNVIKEQTVELRNELFTNFLMQNSQLTKT